MFWTAAWRKTRDSCFRHYVSKTIYLCSRKLLQYLTEIWSDLFSWRLKCYYSQINLVGTDRENIVPGNLCITWKVNEAWPLKKDSVTFLRLLKLLMLKKNSITFLRLFNFLISKEDTITVLKVFNTVKNSVTYLWLLKSLILKKGCITFLRFLKFFILKKDSTTSLWPLKVLILKNDSITFLWLLTFSKIAIL